MAKLRASCFEVQCRTHPLIYNFPARFYEGNIAMPNSQREETHLNQIRGGIRTIVDTSIPDFRIVSTLEQIKGQN